MATQILMPALSPTMTEGTIAKWLKVEGDTIVAGDLLAEIETDKATMELEAVEEGILGKIIKPDGAEGIAVNEPIAIIIADGEDIPDIEDLSPSQNIETAELQKILSNNEPQVLPEEIERSLGELTKVSNIPNRSSPLARRLALNAGLEISEIQGSGPNGRIIKRDVEEFIANIPQRKDLPVASDATLSVPAVVTSDEKVPTAVASFVGEEFAEIPHSNMRRVIAERLTKSSQEIPHFFLTIDCEIERLLEMRRELNDRSQEIENSYKISVNDFVVSAVALAIKKVPMINVSWTDEVLRQFKNIDISIAVATEGGLITPIIRNADQKGLAEISLETKDLVARARSGKLKPQEYQGGSFTISNLGMYGVKEFSAIINQPQSCILAVGAGEKRAVIKDGALSIATMMSCTLSVDHRSIDGALGAQFLKALKMLIEDPLTMIL